MLKFAWVILVALVCCTCRADEKSACDATNGRYRSGTVTAGPTFQHGHSLNGVELSHSILSVVVDLDQRVYQVAIDNVFANGFEGKATGVPAPLDTIKIGDRLDLCGELYTQGVGIHFVHTNCGDTTKPDGWVKMIASDGSAGANLEANRTYCALFQHGWQVDMRPGAGQ